MRARNNESASSWGSQSNPYTLSSDKFNNNQQDSPLNSVTSNEGVYRHKAYSQGLTSERLSGLHNDQVRAGVSYSMASSQASDRMSDCEGELPVAWVRDILVRLQEKINMTQDRQLPFPSAKGGERERLLLDNEPPLIEKLIQRLPGKKDVMSATALSTVGFALMAQAKVHKGEMGELLDALSVIMNAAWARKIKPELEQLVVEELAFLEEPETFQETSASIRGSTNIGHATIGKLANAGVSVSGSLGFSQFRNPDFEKLFEEFTTVGGRAGLDINGPLLGIGVSGSYQKGQFTEPGTVKVYAKEDGFRYQAGKRSIYNSQDLSVCDKSKLQIQKVTDTLAPTNTKGVFVPELDRALISCYEDYQQRAHNQSERLQSLLKSQLGIDCPVKDLNKFSPPPVRPANLMGSIGIWSMGAKASVGRGFSWLNNVAAKLGGAYKGVDVNQADRTPIWNSLLISHEPLGVNAKKVYEQRALEVSLRASKLTNEEGKSSLQHYLGGQALEYASSDELRAAVKKLGKDFGEYSRTLKHLDDLQTQEKNISSEAGTGQLQKVLRGEKERLEKLIEANNRHDYLWHMALLHGAIGLKTIEKQRGSGENQGAHFPLSVEKEGEFQKDLVRLQNLSDKIQFPEFGYDLAKVHKKLTFSNEIHISARTLSSNFTIQAGVGNRLKGDAEINVNVDWITRVHPSRFRQGDYIDITLDFSAGADIDLLLSSERFAAIKKQVGQSNWTELLGEVEKQGFDNRRAGGGHHSGGILTFRLFKSLFKQDRSQFTDKGFLPLFSRVQYKHHNNIAAELGLGNGRAGADASHGYVQHKSEHLLPKTMTYLMMRLSRMNRHGEVTNTQQSRADFVRENVLSALNVDRETFGQIKNSTQIEDEVWARNSVFLEQQEPATNNPNSEWARFSKANAKDLSQMMQVLGQAMLNEGKLGGQRPTILEEAEFFLDEHIEKTKQYVTTHDEKAYLHTEAKEFKGAFYQAMKNYTQVCQYTKENNDKPTDYDQEEHGNEPWLNLTREQAYSTALEALKTMALNQVDYWWNDHQSNWHPQPYHPEGKDSWWNIFNN